MNLNPHQLALRILVACFLSMCFAMLCTIIAENGDTEGQRDWAKIILLLAIIATAVAAVVESINAHFTA